MHTRHSVAHALGLAALVLMMGRAFAANPYAVGDTITNPDTGAMETVTDLLGDDMVLTDQGNAIRVLSINVGDTFDDPDNPGTTLEVTAVHTNATTGLVDSITTTDNASPANIRDIALVKPVDQAPPPSDPGNPGGSVPLPIPSGNINVVADAQVGSQGAAGHDGYGVRVCIIDCFTIGRSAAPGESGGTGPDINRTITGADIESVSGRLPGVTASSRGGNGGHGGDAYVSVNVPAAQGGSAGAGGNVTVTSDVNVTTSGAFSYGLFAQSRAGNGGSGGDGYVISPGGGGGPPGKGGNVLATNMGTITTHGFGAVGLYAQSLGGGGGSGGDSYGIVGVAGAASEGGNGGTATAINDGVITTLGAGAHGILAESIGGNGGDAGAAGGIVGLGDSGDSGGSANPASATNNGRVETYGDGSIGVFAQSVGGGGGNGSPSGGLVSIGGSGSAGGAGAAASVTNAGSVVTHGARANAMLVQSIGGGGGNGGTNGGVFFTLGGSGASGGTASTATATNQGSLTTSGDDSFGLLAQSVGGGGGNGGSSGSLSAFAGVAIGGAGGNGGDGATVTVNSADGASIDTRGDRSTGLLAQSVGGGGGNGGFAAQVTGGYDAGVSVAVGGSGGDGGNGGTVNVNGNSTITTAGADADGLIAQSLGGGGGHGGFAVSFAGAAGGAAGISIAVGVGGSGGGGGDGGDVNLNAGGEITTTGDRSEGLVAQSLGGGGGKGGFSVSIGAAAAGGVAGSVAVGVGGKGGGGGDAGTVGVAYAGNVSTSGEAAHAVDVESVGGGGGNGAFNVSGTVQGSGTGSAGVTVGVGGSGGGGGDGGTVAAYITGDLTTQGEKSDALYAQSAGGGGGNGAFNVSGSITATSGPGGAVAVGVGGSGGDGGDGKRVDAELHGNATTHGATSDGVFVQSVGGAGGNGAFNVSGAISLSTAGGAGVAVGVGGSGGGGGDGGVVGARIFGDVNTYAEQSGGLLAQSIGGSGGNGAFNVSGAISLTDAGSGAAAVGFGGSGGSGGDGSTVDAKMFGDVTTRKNTSVGVFAQSLGGAGGNGAFNVSGGISVSSEGGGAISVGVGGSGGGGGAGKAVNLTVDGDVTTSGDRSAGITGQSLGGGGGDGAFNVTGGVAASGSGAGTIGVGFGGAGGDGGDAGKVTANVTGNTSTQGADSNAILVQSNGGGGGNGAFNITGDLTVAQAGGGGIGVGVGGFGGGGGDGGVVDATVNGDATTQGNRSSGVLLQSKGGGGGNGAVNITGGLSLTGLSTSGAGATAAIGVGGFGGDGGNGSTVTGHVSGTVVTHGDDSVGVLAQSVGGGGGNGALNVSGAVQLSTNSSAGATIGVGGFGGGGGNAGTVTLVRSGGTTTTHGANSDGIVAQSVGGAGGNGGINISGALSLAISNPLPTTNFAGTFGLGGFGGDGGDAQNVKATVTGDVKAMGYGGDTYVLDDGISRIVRADGSNGVLAQSVGGDGGNGRLNVSAGIGFAAPSSGNKSGALNIGVGGWAGGGGDAGTVDLHVDAGIVKSIGDGRVGVGAQSLGGSGGNGGINVSGGIALDGQANFGVGGFGGEGGLAHRVTATSNTNIDASGNGAIGFLAQSVGGGGGKGRINVTGGIEGATESSTPSVSFGLGGSGGAGNASGNVTATQQGAIAVDGVDSIGVLAQSVGGGGGIGGFDVSGNLGLGKGYTGAIGIGGRGGAGADAGSVTLTSDGQIVVDGTDPSDPNAPPLTPEQREQIDSRQRAKGILAQSIGGGGGNGGINITGAFAPIGSPLGMGVGGFGGAGGDANVVNVYRGQNTPALLKTTGNNANGLTAQSIGGGGGNAGADILLEGSGYTSDSSAQQVQLVVGGAGGAAGEGRAVTVEQHGDVSTGGDHSDAVLAQSIGGGGGNAALSLGAGLNNKTTGINLAVGGGSGDGGGGDKVTVHHAGTISTQGFDSNAIFAQSVGGGGGNAAFTLATSLRSQGSFDLGLGRVGGTGGKGGDVEVTSNGDLSTQGDRAIGILAQSVGNGGGKSGAFSIGAKAPSGEESAGQSTKGTLSVGLEGGEGGSAGSVHVTTDGSITTNGSDAYAIDAQSVGGGGGIGGGATNLVFLDTNTVGVGVGGKGGKGGASGAVNVDNSAALTTQGDGAHAVYAQSVGGAGGVGGYAGVMKLVAGKSAADGSFTGTVSVGGKGGTGADGKWVYVTNSGSISTNGKKAFGINAESVGGGGGDGGMVINGAITRGTEPAALSLGVGGSGNSGGTSAKVTVINEGTVHTTGEGSVGIEARSVGGGGGDGGLVVNLNLTPIGTESSGFNSSVNIGGSGGSGNAAGAVEVTNERPQQPTVLLASSGTASSLTPASNGQRDSAGGGVITTEKNSADGIYAESVGGGGGDGSSVVSAMLARGGEDTIALGVNVGGDGGSGGTGGAVKVTNEAQIDTKGTGANGIVARSVGGGGGSGGMAITTNAIISAAAHGNTALVVVGGSGSAGNDGGNITVNNSGSIITHGDRSDGIVAQSIGGGGGDAGVGLGMTSGVASTAVAGVMSALFGGRGGDGGQGGAVTVNHSGDITVLGNNSHAVTAESINGGGGGIALDFNGITSLPGGTALPGSPQGTDTRPIFVFHGGAAGTQSSNAGLVTLNYTGTFGAAGNDGAGNSAQAIGGGGGNFDANLGIVDATTAPEDSVELQGTLGGDDGISNDGGGIVSKHVGDVMTTGLNTPGLLMQSIGGGGGRADLNVSSDTGSLGTSTFRVGGQNGTDERGGDVTHTQSGSISTAGTASHGALLQSIGGGGGLLSYRLADGGAAPVPAAGKIRTQRYDAIASTRSHSAPVSVSFGSAGGSGLDGRKIRFDMSGDVSTSGDNSVGLILQSIGGGGGTANVIGGGALDVAIGGSAGATGNGGEIDAVHTGNVSTTGLRSHGVILQSIGGGGSAVFTDVPTPTVTVSADNAGNGGGISFAQVGDIVTSGAGARGLLVQSLGGGGGFVDGAFAGSAGGAGAGGAISLSVDGNVMTRGDRSTALFAQSDGGLGGGDIKASLTAGHALVGGADGAAVAFDGGANNVFENHGTIMTLSGPTGMAFTGGAGNDAFVNDGVVVGNVSMGGGVNRFANDTSAVLDSGTTVDLGSSNNLMINDGVLAPGGAQGALVTNLVGSFRQSARGKSDFELDFDSGVLDSLVATGTAQLSGTVDVSLLHTYAVKPGQYTKVLYFAADGLTDTGLALATRPSVVVTYDLQHPDTKTVALGYRVDFAPTGLVGNRSAIGEYINRMQASGSSTAFGPTVEKLVQQSALGPYSYLLTQLGPEFYVEQQVSLLTGVQWFSRLMQDCGSLSFGRTSGDSPACVWVRVDADSSSREAKDGFPAMDGTAHRYSQGIQRSKGGWTYGAGMEYEHDDLDGLGSTWSARNQGFRIGAVGRRSFGRSSVGAVLSYGIVDEDVRRHLSVADQLTALGRRYVSAASLVFDVRQHIDLDGVTVTPSLSVGVAKLHGRSMTEGSAGAESEVLYGTSSTHAWVEPSLAFDFERSLKNRRQLHAYARLGALHYVNGDTTTVLAGLAGAPAGLEPMRISSDLDRTHLVAEAGFKLTSAHKLTFGISYEKRRSNIRESGTTTFRISIPIH